MKKVLNSKKLSYITRSCMILLTTVLIILFFFVVIFCFYFVPWPWPLGGCYGWGLGKITVYWPAWLTKCGSTCVLGSDFTFGNK